MIVFQKLTLNNWNLYISRQQVKLLVFKKTFDDLVNYHNQMIVEKAKFITKELPSLENSIAEKNESLKKLLSEEKKLASVISKSESFEELELLIIEMNEKFRKKGEYENVIQQLEEVENNMKDYNKQLIEIDDKFFRRF